VKKAYLIKYSNANTSVFDREKFSSAIVQSFQSATRSVVLHWSCCMEQHQNGSYRFHIAVLLDIAQRWMKVKMHQRQLQYRSELLRSPWVLFGV